ncbi:hypothetical protein [Streptomyces sp. NPDC094468]|uniref:hypothetical protein n=1 Tax=Streptomyces sp. NPDC094468 TaxID=3366066 RepID=UPI0037FB0B13
MDQSVTINHIAQYGTVVLEGGDGVGKTTLASLLVTQYGFSAVHSPRTPDHENLIDRYRDLLARPGRLVLDRSFISELVYGPLYRGQSRLTWQQTLALASIVSSRNGVFLHLTAPATTVQSRLTARDGQRPRLATITELADAYHHVFCDLASHAPVLTYDSTTEGSNPNG